MKRMLVIPIVGIILVLSGLGAASSIITGNNSLSKSGISTIVASTAPISKQFNQPGNLLISDQFNNRVIETTPDGKIIWTYGLGPFDFNATSPLGVNDAQRVGRLTLLAATSIPAGVDIYDPNGSADNRVMLVTPRGRIVWQYGQFGITGNGSNQLNTPVQCTWLPHHHVLITDQGNNRIIEVNWMKRIVWQYPGSNHNTSDQLSSPNSAELLKNGHILISDEGNSRVIEVTRGHKIVKTFTASGTLGEVAFASRLPNGDTLLSDAGNNRAVEVNVNDTVVWQYVTNTDPQSLADPGPSRALRLKNGDTLISDQFNNRVIRVNMSGFIVASYGLPLANGTNNGYDVTTVQNGLYAPYDAKINGDFTGLTRPHWCHCW